MADPGEPGVGVRSRSRANGPGGREAAEALRARKMAEVDRWWDGPVAGSRLGHSIWLNGLSLRTLTGAGPGVPSRSPARLACRKVLTGT
jgi:hypothetical protein